MAEILLSDNAERARVLTCQQSTNRHSLDPKVICSQQPDEHQFVTMTPTHNDSTVSSASQLLEDPSPVTWAFESTSSDLEGQFTLRRQRGIRRKRRRKEVNSEDDLALTTNISGSKCAKKRSLSLSPKSERKRSRGEAAVLCEAINKDVKRFQLETDLDCSMEATCSTSDTFATKDHETMDVKVDETKAITWISESPRSSLMEQSSKSFLTSICDTPEAPLVATVRRCLKYSPECELLPRTVIRGFIEISCSIVNGNEVHVKG